MNSGMLWFDNSPKMTLAQKVKAAADYYRQKYGVKPTFCMVNPSMLGEEVEFDGVLVKSYRPVLPGYLWIGIADASETVRRVIEKVEAL